MLKKKFWNLFFSIKTPVTQGEWSNASHQKESWPKQAKAAAQTSTMYMYHFFTNYGVGETRVDMNCDNCSGQVCALSGIVPGGPCTSSTTVWTFTSWSQATPPWCFGLIKQHFRKTRVNTVWDCWCCEGTAPWQGSTSHSWLDWMIVGFWLKAMAVNNTWLCTSDNCQS